MHVHGRTVPTVYIMHTKQNTYYMQLTTPSTYNLPRVDMECFLHCSSVLRRYNLYYLYVKCIVSF